MNKLQAIPSPGEFESPGRVLVTMNPVRIPRSPQSSHFYEHPVISSKSMLALRQLHKINGTAGVSFAGAWMGYGFHEDGFVAGAHAARMLIDGRENTPPLELGTLPDSPLDDQRLSWKDAIVRAVIAAVQLLL